MSFRVDNKIVTLFLFLSYIPLFFISIVALSSKLTLKWALGIFLTVVKQSWPNMTVMYLILTF